MTANETTEYAAGKLLARRQGPIGHITFNQPEKRNAMSVEMWAGVEQVLGGWQADESLRVLVLTGAGEKAFISGADISQFEKQRADASAQKEYDRLVSGGRRRLADFPKPVIAEIRGFCLGGGLAVAMLADIRICEPASQFGIPAARMGIAYPFSAVERLIQLVGPAHASEILFTGERIDAAEAMRIGLVNRVVPAAELSATVEKLANTIAGGAPLSVRASKLTIREVLRDANSRDLQAIAQAFAACMNSDDYREGRTAFLEKRPPVFRGR